MIKLRLLIETKNKEGETFKNKLYFNTKESLERYLDNMKKSDNIIVDYKTDLVIVD